MTFAEKVSLYRVANGITPNAMAKILGISRTTYMELEAGKEVKIKPGDLTNLEKMTAIPLTDWMNDSKSLTFISTQATAPKRGRKTVTRTQEHQREQRLIAVRLRQIIDKYYEGNQRLFAETVKINETEISRLLDNLRDISQGRILQIARLTNLSARWIRTGEGSPEETEINEITSIAENHEGKQLEKFLLENSINWSQLQIALGYKSLSSATELRDRKQFRGDTRTKIVEAMQALGYTEKDVFGSKKVVSYNSPEIAPELYVQIIEIPVSARAGFNYENFINDNRNDIEYINVPKSYLTHSADPSRYKVIAIDGDSMEPYLRPGMRVLGYLINPGDWAYLRGTVAVDMENEFVVKRILHNTLDNLGYVELTSDNPLGGKITAHRNKIRNIWKMLRIIDGPVD